jgi:NitT/TauT family transport system substrate-binding protein
MRRTIAFAFGFIAAVAATEALAQMQTLKVAVAQRGFWNSSFVEFALQQGYFKQEGLEIEILYTEGGASTLLPVVAGSIDVAMTNGTLGVIAAFAKGMPVKIISAEATGAPTRSGMLGRRAGSSRSRIPPARRWRSPRPGPRPI